MNKQMKKNMKRFLSMFLAVLMICSLIEISPVTAQAASVSNPVDCDTLDYGLQNDIQDGVILHCWDWSFNNIKAQMATIAEAGYSAIQTSPIQEAKEATKGVSNANWWVFYQPKSFTIDNSGTSGLGTKAEFQAMCEEAHKYGIKVIVDIVANHTGNDGAGGIASTVIDDIKNDSSCYHNYGNFKDINYGDRYSITHDSMGLLPDLNTENTKIQNYVISLLKECIDSGADGFRFDAAKHISVPSEGSEYTFWPTVINAANSYASSTRGITLYNYGEILDDTGGPAMTQYTQYMSVTDNKTSNDIRNDVAGGNASGAATSYYQKGVSADNLVLWAESHDTYSNDNKESTYVSNTDIKKTWAIVASRANATSLYYVRTNGWRQGTIGDICTWDWMSDEVVAVNKFHNYFNGQSEYLSSSGSIAYNERGTSGVVLVNCGGTSTSVSVKANKMADGTYTDQITGDTFTVSGGTISGQIGSTGIAVIYNAVEPVKEPTPTISKEGGSFSTDTLTLTVGLKNATSGTYQIGSGSVTTYTSSKSITIGSDMAVGDSVTVKLTATDGTTTTSKSYTFKKIEQAENVVYFQNSSSWNSVYAYYWSDANTTMSTWPGVQMTSVGSGVYSIEVPEDATYIIFNSGATGGQTDDLTIQMGKIYKNGTWTNYDPKYQFVPPYENGVYFENTAGWSQVYLYYWSDSNTAMTTWPGVAMVEVEDGIYGYELSASSDIDYVIFNNNNNGAQTDDLDFVMNGYYNNSGYVKTVETTQRGTVTVKYVDESGNEIAASKTMTGNVGDAYTTSAATIDGYTLKSTPSNATGTYTASAITVKYVYSEVVNTDPVVTSSLASGSTFKTETQTITLTLKNAVSGTYTVDDGPTKTFTSTASVVLGQGKVADSTVTVKATATSSDGTTKTFTFTYNKQFNGTVNEETGTVSAYSTSAVSAVATASATSSSQGLASQYTTNAAGLGVKKTISVDGDLSDWNSSMLIAQGAANDDPRVYRDNSMYELPIDLYALYGAYDDSNLYLMWEMTNVQDVVAPNDNYPLSQGILWQTQELPFFIAIDTGNSSTAIGNNGQLTTGGTIWDSGMTISSSFNKLISINTKGGNGPFVYSGNSSGLNPVEELDATTSKIKMNYGLGILSSSVNGINGAYGAYNGRVVGDVCSNSADWVNFNTLGHSSGTMDFFYELSIPLSELGVTASDVASNGLGVLLVATFGKSAMDCLPYDVSMNDNADLPDTESQEFNSYEKSDADYITTSFARVGANGSGGGGGTIIPTELELNFGADRSSPQASGTALTLSGIAEGGTAPYTYKYYVNNTLVATKSGSGETTTSWSPSAGSYMIKCVVTDANGTSVTSAKNYTVEGTTSPLTGTLKVNGSTADLTKTVGSSITLNASAAGGSGSYTYKFAVLDVDAGAWTILRDFSSSASYTYTLTGAGVKQFAVTVKDSNGTTVSTNRLNVTVEKQTEVLSGLLQVNGSTADLTKAIGSSITLNASAAGGSGSYTYKFAVLDVDAGAWTILRDFSSSASYTYTLTGAGVKQFAVTVKDSNGTTVSTNRLNVTVEKQTEVLSGVLQVNGSTEDLTRTIGSSITLNASAAGGTGSYTYKFAVLDVATNKWTILRDFSSSASYTYTLTAAGEKQFAVTVKDSNGTTVAANRLNVTVEKQTEVLSGVLQVNGSTADLTKTVGSSITLNASAAGGTGSYTYKFAVLDVATSKWTILRDFSSSASYTYTLTGTGVKQFAVTVKDSNGTTVAANRLNVTVKQSTALSGFLQVNGSTADLTKTAGSSITLNAAATGGSGSYTYKFAVLNVDTGNWTILRDFNSSSSYTYTLTGTGVKQFAVTVKDSNGTTVATNRLNVTVKESAVLTGVLRVNGSTADLSKAKGSSITLNVAATGGSGSYTYKFAVLNVATGSWVVLRDFSSSSSYTYELNYPGVKQFAVTVKDSTGATVATNKLSVTVTE